MNEYDEFHVFVWKKKNNNISAKDLSRMADLILTVLEENFPEYDSSIQWENLETGHGNSMQT